MGEHRSRAPWSQCHFCRSWQHFKVPLLLWVCVMPDFLAFCFSTLRLLPRLSFLPSLLQAFLAMAVRFHILASILGGRRWLALFCFYQCCFVTLCFLEPLLQPNKFTASSLLLFSSLLDSLPPNPSPMALHFPLSLFFISPLRS